ncbi:protein kinase [Parendozoicomonas sp. Alg238-R29]|uniref:protein kinase domain-containing protein n=1 Tax=Parendozoicomonas sp. Alg238-R29 TaxID=2993446 RepID=UPI00248EF063|nr:protein kinase [Parendozoicomonas sp. Alg238-R29]
MQPVAGKNTQTTKSEEAVATASSDNVFKKFGRLIKKPFIQTHDQQSGRDCVVGAQVLEPPKQFTKRDIAWNKEERHESPDKAVTSMLGITSTAAPLLGKGAYGTVSVWQNAHLNSQKFALKMLSGKDDNKPYEGPKKGEGMALLACGCHPNIVQTYALLLREEKTDNYAVIYQHAIWEIQFLSMRVAALVSECVDGQSLKSLLEPDRHTCLQNITSCTAIAEQAACALSYLHKQGFVFRDVKPGNLIVNPDDLHTKLTDFGFCIHLHRKARTQSFCGTIPYLAPEMVSAFHYQYTDTYKRCPEYDKSVDVWALGVSFMRMVTGYRPSDYQASTLPLDADISETHPKNRSVIFKRIKTFSLLRPGDKYSYCIRSKVLPDNEKKIDAVNLIAKLLDNDPKRRKSMDTVHKTLQEMNKSPTQKVKTEAP